MVENISEGVELAGRKLTDTEYMKEPIPWNIGVP